MKKIFEIEKNISELNGVKIEYKDLLENNKYFHGKNFCKIFSNFSVSDFLYTFTECRVPEEYICGIYHIPVEKPEDYEKYYKFDECTIPKEVLIFIGSSDGETAEYICPIFTPYLDAQTEDEIMSKILK